MTTTPRVVAYLAMFVPLSIPACSDANECDYTPIDTMPPDTGGEGDTGMVADTMALDLEDGAYAFEGTPPGTEDVESADSCAGDCYRCLTLSDGRAVATFYGDTVETVEFTYLAQATGSYNVDLLYLWTAARSQGMGSSYASAYLVVQRQNSAPVVLELSECIGH